MRTSGNPITIKDSEYEELSKLDIGSWFGEEWKVYLSREMVGDFQVSRAGWIGDYEDPNTFLDLMRPNRGNNKTGWEDAAYDAIMEKANSTNDQEERYKLLQEAERVLIDNMPIIDEIFN